MNQRSLSDKANRILNLVLGALLLILIRVWYLSVIQHDARQEEAFAPQRRARIELVDRATIRDRFNVPLAINQVQYQAAIVYSPIREIPKTVWKMNEKGERIRSQERVEYISRLTHYLAKELELDPLEIEDQIYAKAALFPHLPCLIKSDISEKSYYRLKMAEKDWPGLTAQHISKRVYPQGKIGSGIVGYMGAISQKEFHSIADEIAELQTYLEERASGIPSLLPKGFDSPLQVKERLCDLQEKAYKINDRIGKAGIEKMFDEELRGFYGESVHEVTRNGNQIRKLPCSRPPIAGKRILLSISLKLQEYAENLLIESEKTRSRKEEPWIKGGAIVAMIPKTGEVVALASCPRFDPNDFIEQKRDNCLRWLETESLLSRIWEGREPLQREVWKKGAIVEENIALTWDLFLDRSVGTTSSVRRAMNQVHNIKNALRVQQEPNHPLFLQIPLKEDQLLLLDLCRLIVKEEHFPLELLQEVGEESLTDYFATSQAFFTVEAELKLQMRKLFHTLSFSQWRQKEFKNFLKEKRSEEKAKKTYAHPYTEYLEKEEKRQFQQFWTNNRYTLLKIFLKQLTTISEELKPYLPFLEALDSGKKEAFEHLKNLPNQTDLYLQSMRSFKELDRPLIGQYKNLRGQLEKDLAAAFYPLSGYGYSRSLAYRAAAPQGSVFKLVTAYQALVERLEELKTSLSQESLNPLTLIDNLRSSHPAEQLLGSTLSGEPIYRNYKGGKLPRSSHSGIGKIDLVSALEQSSNIYFSILAGDYLKHPSNLAHAARYFGFGKKTEIDLPGETSGNIPTDLENNRTGLYAYAIGQHTLTVTPLQTARMLAALVNGGELLKPQIVRMVAGKEPSKQDRFLSCLGFPFKKELNSVGLFFPLFTETNKNRENQTSVHEAKKEVIETLFLPKEILDLLIEGMRQTVSGAKGSARASLIRQLPISTSAISNYVSLQDRLIGKTGTAQILHKDTIDAETRAEMRDHVWFGGIGFSKESNEPELVVVVYLPFGLAGKVAAPLVAQVITKWEEILAQHEPVSQKN